MTSISMSTTVLPSAALGAPNPLPRFRWQQPTPLQCAPPVGLNPEELEGYIAMGRQPILPYGVQDDYARDRREQAHASVSMENEHLQLCVLPDLGGRLYSMIDKHTGRDLVFRNPVFQPANLAVRNAWFSGGIEWNGGSVPGHVASTCSPVFCHRVNTEKGPILRIHDFDRISETAWQIDLYLPKGMACLYVHGRIVNPNADARDVYWWTNATTPFHERMRIVAPASYVIEHAQLDNHLERFGFPCQWGFDGSYPGHWQSSTSVFFRPTPSDTPWLVACSPDGPSLAHVATSALGGRKYFFFGTGEGGVHWSDYLSEKGQGQYVEIQAGLMPTQNQLYRLQAEEAVEWTECLFSLDDCEPALYGDYDNAVEWMKSRVYHSHPVRALSETDSFLRKCALETHSETFSRGACWGSLHEKLTGTTISAGMSFLVAEGNSVWERLARGEPIRPDDDIPVEFAVSPRWEQLLRDDLVGKADTWLHHALLGIVHLEREEFEDARKALVASRVARPSWLSHRCLAILGERCNELEMAAECFTDACSSLGCPHQVFLERAECLLRIDHADELDTLLDNLPDGAARLERIRILRARRALERHEYEALRQLLDYPFASIREGEEVLSDLWRGLVLGEAAQTAGRVLTSAEADVALRSAPLPFELDFVIRRDVRIARP